MVNAIIAEPASVTVQMRASDRLTNKLERDSIKLNKFLLGYFKRNPSRVATAREMNSFLSKAIYENAGYQAENMSEFISASTGIDKADVVFAAALTTGMFIETSKISKEVFQFKTFSPVGKTGTVLNEQVMTQVDRTQTKYKPYGNWFRHLNGGGCEWCVAQVSEFEQTRRWLRHGNCRCSKVMGV